MSVTEVRTQIYLQETQHEALKKAAEERRVSMAQVVREAVSVYLAGPVPAGPDPLTDDDAYRTDAAWRLLDVAQRIGGSAPGADASHLDEDLYGPVAR